LKFCTATTTARSLGLAHLDAQCLAYGDQILHRVKSATIRCGLGRGQAATRLGLGQSFGVRPRNSAATDALSVMFSVLRSDGSIAARRNTLLAFSQAVIMASRVWPDSTMDLRYDLA
jgi:hypothetical protein